MTTQPEALRLAAALTRAVEQEAPDDDTIVVARWFVENAAAELRRLHESNKELLAALKLAADNAYWPDTKARLGAIIAKAERTTT